MRFFLPNIFFFEMKKTLGRKKYWNFWKFSKIWKNPKFTIGKSIFFIEKYIENFGFFSDFWKFSNFQIFFSSKIFFHFKKKCVRQIFFSCQSEILCRFQKSYLERLGMSANAPLSPAPLFFPYLNRSLHIDGWPSIILWYTRKEREKYRFECQTSQKHLLHFVLVTKECSWLAWEQTLNWNTLGEHLNTVKESADCRNSFWQPVYQHRAKKHRGRLVSVLSTHAKRRGTSQTFFVRLLRVYGTSEVVFLGSEEVYSTFGTVWACAKVYTYFCA